MLGLTGYSDLNIKRNAENGNVDCQLALAMNAYRIKKYIGSYSCLNGLDAIIFYSRNWRKFLHTQVSALIWNILELNWMHPK
jgi:acetate kinase